MSHPLNILIGSIAAGHVNPAVPIARAFVERGHTVHSHTGRAHRAVEATS